jgi:hypothetical protein
MINALFGLNVFSANPFTKQRPKPRRQNVSSIRHRDELKIKSMLLCGRFQRPRHMRVRLSRRFTRFLVSS